MAEGGNFLEQIKQKMYYKKYRREKVEISKENVHNGEDVTLRRWLDSFVHPLPLSKLTATYHSLNNNVIFIMYPHPSVEARCLCSRDILIALSIKPNLYRRDETVRSNVKY